LRVSVARHPTTKTWTFPPERAPDANRTNLKELAARPERFEHHLTVVARLGVAQLEIATASEPVYFAHLNLSDEYAVALPTGDPMIDAFPLRTFVSDERDGSDVARYNHRCGDLVLHPYGYAHWPGKLRPPFAPIPFPPGMRRCVLSLVYCASTRTPSTASIVPLPAGRKADDVKSYVDPPPTLSLAALLDCPDGSVVARVGGTQLEVVERPARLAPARGGWVVVLAGRAPCDLIRIAPGDALDGAGIERALVLSGDAEPEPVPSSWTELPPPPFAVAEDAPRTSLPLAIANLVVEAASETTVRITVTPERPENRFEYEHPGPIEVPRYWLARLLYRCALHGLQFGRVETYGGFFVDDSGPDVTLGVAQPFGRFGVTIPRAEALATIERLYRAVAPSGYTERLT
jgi:hypothetical protein